MINDVKWFPLIVLSLETYQDTTQLLWLTNKIVELSLKDDSIEFLKNTFTLKKKQFYCTSYFSPSCPLPTCSSSTPTTNSLQSSYSVYTLSTHSSIIFCHLSGFSMVCDCPRALSLQDISETPHLGGILSFEFILSVTTQRLWPWMGAGAKWQLCFYSELSLFYQNRPVECPHHCRCPFQSPGPLSPQSWARPQDTQIPSLGAAAQPRPSVQMFRNLEVLIFIPAASHLAAKGLLDAGRCAECTFLLNSWCLSRTNCC